MNAVGLKEDILLFLDNETSNFNESGTNETFTATKISELFNVRRNTVSHYLNQLVDEEKVIKINSRPVYFLSRLSFEQKFFPVSQCIFTSFQDIFSNSKEIKPKNDMFDRIIGSDGSLKKAIEQIKASIHYPDNGLPIILCGQTGVGKSYTAELIHRYSVEKNILPPDAPFISFNCAQYADNPELISSNLFGYVKGAFTGADKTTEGMLSEADGGILFLDEVHRLNAEGQEKLFTFLDQGIFRRMGESGGSHKARVRLIFATTENLEERFLQTFLRRIPIRVMLPGLDERGEKEKKQFVYMFLIEEAKKTGKSIRITNRALDTLIKHHYLGNIGDLKNTAKYIVASSYVKKQDAKEVFISIHDLPEKILEETLRYTDHKIKQNNDIIIDSTLALDQIVEID
ncbi:sigma-54-dependent transcriptional regulator, partial [Bacillus sp. JJ1764]|uniref:sigma-54-dependent transcriptional regulator n=1 Tax=Bacillus sp. JJ1764 TaxID=3122964 RepID=UPI002FFE2193